MKTFAASSLFMIGLSFTIFIIKENYNSWLLIISGGALGLGLEYIIDYKIEEAMSKSKE